MALRSLLKAPVREDDLVETHASLPGIVRRNRKSHHRQLPTLGARRWPRPPLSKLYDEHLAETCFSPPYLEYQTHGQLPPIYKLQLQHARKRHDAKKITENQARYYEQTQMLTDRETAAKIHDMDGILRQDALRRQNPEKPDPSPWRFQRSLGAGGQGKVMKWARKDPITGTMQYLAVKDCRSQGFDADYNGEYYLMRRLNHRGCKNVVRAFDHGHYMVPGTNKPHFRMVLEYCSLGDLHSFKEFYVQAQLAIPESFIWHIILEVSKALLFCHNGGIHEEQAPDWEPIVHMDIKERNLLLGEMSEESDGIYPVVLLTDFGCAWTLPNEQIADYKSAWSRGTTKYMDPALSFKSRRSPTHDIWSFGVMLNNLVKVFLLGLTSTHRKVITERPDLLTLRAPRFIAYSDRLTSLISSCRSPEIELRPTAWQVYETAKREWDVQLESLKRRRLDADLDKPYEGVVLFGDDRRRFESDPEYTVAVYNADWRNTNRALMDDLNRAAGMLERIEREDRSYLRRW